MIITREMVLAMGVCGQGLANFDFSFPNGSGEFNDVFREARRHDEREGGEVNAGFVLLMKSDVRVLLLAGRIVAMNEIYQVFDPIVGQYTQYTSIEEAKAARRVVMDAFIQANIAQFHVAQEVITDEGNSLWNPLTEEQLK